MEIDQFGPFAVGERIRVPTHVVLSRIQATPDEVNRVRESGEHLPGPDHVVCELVAGGEIIASGKLLKRGGEWYMQIEELGEGNED